MNAPNTGKTLPSTRPLFVDQPQVGLFVVRHTEEGKKQAAGPAIVIRSYRSELQVTKSLPPIDQKEFRLSLQKAEGDGSEQLALQEWFPTEKGAQLVLAFNPLKMINAKDCVFLGAGEDVPQVWSDCERFYACLKGGKDADTLLVAAAMVKKPPPYVTFFRLLFSRDRSVYDTPEVCRAAGSYLGDAQIPALERRKAVAHYMPPPQARDAAALSELAGGMLNLIVHLQGADQGGSAVAVLQRLHGFFYDQMAGKYRIAVPAADEKRLNAVRMLAAAPGTPLEEKMRASLMQWLGGKK